eukprot:CAMPEP_0206614630 /NCGR_PEP_ID=MMETSP0325_2-20121206/57537_1 /ASSEMBLY_ACC=CAM_ASM_000347 /TAXON_ID=2866 /ORGANISM="Crypthecodinium cohnii, Strain Seligo" /LENGTH=143 /DNA_ID=CAMNT_0054135225 /DNA_START=122 /DNA_END=550 /DNA_ORIENTATION=+
MNSDEMRRRIALGIMSQSDIDEMGEGRDSDSQASSEYGTSLSSGTASTDSTTCPSTDLSDLSGASIDQIWVDFTNEELPHMMSPSSVGTQGTKLSISLGSGNSSLQVQVGSPITQGLMEVVSHTWEARMKARLHRTQAGTAAD